MPGLAILAVMYTHFTGYAGSVAYAMIPPLWRRIMDPKVDYWMAQVAMSPALNSSDRTAAS